MDLALLQAALASNSYSDVGNLCDELILQVAALGIPLNEEWPFVIHILGHIYANDLNSARFLWKSIPSNIKENLPELVAAWTIGQKLWTRDYAGVYEAILGFQWSPDAQGLLASFLEAYRVRMFKLMSSAFSTISIQDASLFLGMNRTEATEYLVKRGWREDPSLGMFGVKKLPLEAEKGVDVQKLQKLTQYVFHLEH